MGRVRVVVEDELSYAALAVLGAVGSLGGGGLDPGEEELRGKDGPVEEEVKRIAELESDGYANLDAEDAKLAGMCA